VSAEVFQFLALMIGYQNVSLLCARLVCVSSRISIASVHRNETYPRGGAYCLPALGRFRFPT